MKTTKTWKERIVAVMTGRNDRGVALWYTHKKIMNLVYAHFDVSKEYRSLTPYLSALVKSGHLERTMKPPELSEKVSYTTQVEYLYRRTEKPYERKYPSLKSSKNKYSEAQIRGVQAHELWRMYPTLPKWYRAMMMP